MTKIQLLPILFALGILTSSNGLSQVDADIWIHEVCLEIRGQDTLEVDCDSLRAMNYLSSRQFMDIDSLCLAMSDRFVRVLNQWREDNNIHPVILDENMETRLTTPHNEWQRQEGLISHSENGKSCSQRASELGFYGVAECCAYNHKMDKKDHSTFFLQYKNSPPHWSILTDPDYTHIAVSTLYDRQLNRFYSTVNMR